MNKMWSFIGIISLIASFTGFSYRLEEDQFYAGGGFGINVNATRFHQEPRRTPGAELPLFANLDYLIDRNFGVFGTFSPLFSTSSIAFAFKGGAKYWFSILDTPYIPYVSLAITNTFLFPMGKRPNHYNLGLSPGIGINYFVMAKFMIGAHVHFNPSVGFADGEKKFEFSVASFFDVTIKV